MLCLRPNQNISAWGLVVGLLSVVVPARNDCVVTKECLASAVNALNALNLRCEFVLIDDDSDRAEGIQEVFTSIRDAAAQHRFRIVRARERLHYTGVFSLGIHLSSEEKVFFLSNDMVITPQFFAAVLGVSALRSDIGIVRGTSNYCDCHPEHVVAAPNILTRYTDITSFSQAIFEIKGLAFVEDRVLSGDAVLISRSLIDRIGVLDTRFFGYFGDLDYGLRAHLAGFQLVCAKGAWLWHKGGGHVKAEANARKQNLAIVQSERMRLVETAYQAFRQKWDPTLPPAYGKLESLHLFPMAEKNAARVDLKFEFPAENIAFDETA
jgi:GT2 family glycosyltransferase